MLRYSGIGVNEHTQIYSKPAIMQDNHDDKHLPSCQVVHDLPNQKV